MHTPIHDLYVSAQSDVFIEHRSSVKEYVSRVYTYITTHERENLIQFHLIIEFPLIFTAFLGLII